jgi:hypothetical protein
MAMSTLRLDKYCPGAGGENMGTINAPERPIDRVFGGEDGQTLFILARTSLYSIGIAASYAEIGKTKNRISILPL